jgi:hypothetical protein
MVSVFRELPPKTSQRQALLFGKLIYVLWLQCFELTPSNSAMPSIAVWYSKLHVMAGVSV